MPASTGTNSVPTRSATVASSSGVQRYGARWARAPRAARCSGVPTTHSRISSSTGHPPGRDASAQHSAAQPARSGSRYEATTRRPGVVRIGASARATASRVSASATANRPRSRRAAGRAERRA
ncbi:hypothetical protein [Streptomyces sp. ST2-7A]|uniref:hypothetical protein n=1 Tax=Streptomyces sp. ST2-7A TaxID=2907214 RepID=UPI001F22EF13|nr:hypothetical protein [Streptomyces sp. ST2-7A]MCE7081002.1 hypothetical protein [Streptomyces sp. ST2-7A]